MPAFCSSTLSWVFTSQGPMKFAPAVPTPLAIAMNAVDVVREDGGNHAAESTGPDIMPTVADRARQPVEELPGMHPDEQLTMSLWDTGDGAAVHCLDACCRHGAGARALVPSQQVRARVFWVCRRHPVAVVAADERITSDCTPHHHEERRGDRRPPQAVYVEEVRRRKESYHCSDDVAQVRPQPPARSSVQDRGGQLTVRWARTHCMRWDPS